jgi:beta-mannosidase
LFTADNQFRSYEADVGEHLQDSGNIIRVLFRSPDEVVRERAEKYGFTPPGDERVFLRKAPYQWGWDWGPRLAGVGLYKKPELISYDEIHFEDISIETSSLEGDIATMKARVRVRSDKKMKAEIQLVAESELWTIESLQIKPEQEFYEFDFTVEKPELWWTHDHGKPHLYALNALLFPDGSSKALKADRMVGIRTIELEQKEDEYGRSFAFVLNGKKIFAKGANFIPMSPFPSSVDSDEKIRLISDARESNMNMLRVWGGGIYQEELFYERCSKEGILVWQDFMFACAMYPGNKDFLDNVRHEAREQVRRISSYPCMALWCGNNEISEAWERWGWKDGLNTEQKAKLDQAYRQLFKNILPEAVKAHSSLPYWESSPELGRGDDAHRFQGDAHYWGVWHDAEPFEAFEEKVPRFMSEFGFQSMPSFQTLKSALDDEELFLNSPGLSQRQKHPRGDQLIRQYMSEWYPVPLGLEDFILLSQATQAHGIETGIMAHRIAKPYCMGSLYWQLNDCWPAISWSSIDSKGRWKALQFVAKRGFDPTVLHLTKKEDLWQVHIINDSTHVFEGQLEVTLVNFGGDSLCGISKSVEIEADRSKMLLEFNPKEWTLDFEPEKTFIKAELKNDIYGKLSAHEFFVTPREMELVPVEPAVFVDRTESGYELTILSETLIKDCWIEAESPGRPADNFFDILPYQPKIIEWKYDEGISPEFSIKCWNKLSKRISDRRTRMLSEDSKP